jgi:hypothetical protein
MAVLCGVSGAVLVSIAAVLALYSLDVVDINYGTIDCGSVVIPGSDQPESTSGPLVPTEAFSTWCSERRRDRGLVVALLGVPGVVLAIAGVATGKRASDRDGSSGG